MNCLMCHGNRTNQPANLQAWDLIREMGFDSYTPNPGGGCYYARNDSSKHLQIEEQCDTCDLNTVREVHLKWKLKDMSQEARIGEEG